MLDLDPSTRYVSEASGLEAQIRFHLLVWLDGHTFSGCSEVLGRCLPGLYTLNREHFGADQGIARTLDALAAAAQGTDARLAWTCFLALAETPGDNFGTWAI